MSNITFTKNLIKGKIAEIVFEHMLREAGIFTVIHFGYEYVLPELTRNNQIRNKESIDAIRTAPDFAVINNETKKVHLIEVKYRSRLYKQDMLDTATKMAQSWNPSHIFLATKHGFYFDEISHIIENKGDISRLVHKNIPDEMQQKYLKLLIEMEN